MQPIHNRSNNVIILIEGGNNHQYMNVVFENCALLNLFFVNRRRGLTAIIFVEPEKALARALRGLYVSRPQSEVSVCVCTCINLKTFVFAMV